MSRSVCWCSFAAALSLPSVAAAADVTVDASAPTQALGPTFHGINYVGFWDLAQGSEASAAALANTPVSLVRFPGGAPGDWYDWQCPYFTESDPPCPRSPTDASWSRTSPSELSAYAEQLSAVPLYQTNFQGNPMSLPGVGTAEHAADWAVWAVDNGVPALFEIGNEEDLELMTVHRDPAFGAYIDAFVEQTAAIHAAAPGTVVMGPAATNEYYWWALDSLGMFLEQVGDVSGTGDIDAVSIHFYTGSTWDDSRGVAQYWQSADGPWAFVQDTIATYSTVDLPVYITEWHMGGATASFNASMANALVTADLIGAYAASGVAGHVFFCIHGARLGENAFGLLSGEGEDVAVDTATPAFWAYALWGLMGTDVLAASSDADAANELSVWATGDDGGVQLMAINKTDAALPLAIAIDGLATAGLPVVVHTLAPVGGREAFDVTFNGAMNPDPGAPLPAGEVGEADDGGYATEVPANAIVVVQIGAAPEPGGDEGGADTNGAEDSAGEGPAETSSGAGNATASSDGGSEGSASDDEDTRGCGCSTRGPAVAPPMLLLVLACRRRRDP